MMCPNNSSVTHPLASQDQRTAAITDWAKDNSGWQSSLHALSGLILGLRPADERCSSFVTMSLIGWAQA